MKRILLSISLLTISLAAISQTMMVKDISAGTDGSFPTRLTTFGNRLVFFANDQTANFGNELFSMDSSGEIVMTYNINPGTSFSNGYTNYLGMAVVKNRIYFPANDGTHGTELFSWDGVNPPSLVIDLNPGSAASGVQEVIAYQNKIYFTASTATTGNELWVHDPLKNTTEVLADVNSGTLSSNPQQLTIYNNHLYFAATEPTMGRELYMYDAKTDSLRMVTEVYGGIGSTDPQSMIVGNSRLYFSAYEPTYGRELYCIFDTTVTRLTDVYTGANSGLSTTTAGQNRIGVLNGMVYFGATDGTTGYELYKYDHKTKKTTFVYKINPLGSSFPASFTNFSNKLFFSANDGKHGTELWSYDGVNTPSMAVDIDTAAGISGNPMNFLVHGDGLYFAATTIDYGNELYVYRDPAVGVQKVTFNADIQVYPNPSTSVTNINLGLKKSENLNLRIVDLAGSEVYNTGLVQYPQGNHTISVPVSNFAAGVYIYILTSATGNIYAKGKLTKQ